MRRWLTLYLIRHGETVDNVAQLYAGSRDSELTNHGYQQATRLGLHFRTIGVSFTHIFSSHLQRAAKTAGKVRDAQLAPDAEGLVKEAPDVTQSPLLVEQDFGSLEGKRWLDRPANETPDFVESETKDAMGRRADIFLDEHLLPLFDTGSEDGTVVAIVSHGIFLSTFWKRLLARLPPNSVRMVAEASITARPSLEHLGGWSNTGYLELHMIKQDLNETSTDTAVAVDKTDKSIAPGDLGTNNEVALNISSSEISDGQDTDESQAPRDAPNPAIIHAQLRRLHGWKTTILAVNSKDHLRGLKRTGGGVGSARHDSSQKNIEAFFKRRKTD